MTGMLRDPVSQTWSYYNDETVEVVADPKEFINRKDKNVYILTYERQEPTVDNCLANYIDNMDISKDITHLALDDDEDFDPHFCLEDFLESSAKQKECENNKPLAD